MANVSEPDKQALNGLSGLVEPPGPEVIPGKSRFGTRYSKAFKLRILALADACTQPGEMGKMLRGGVRTVDRVVIAHDAVRYRVAAILPETGADGAQIFERRFADRLAEFLLGYGVAIAPRTAMTATVPGDEETVERIRREFEDLDRR